MQPQPKVRPLDFGVDPFLCGSPAFGLRAGTIDKRDLYLKYCEVCLNVSIKNSVCQQLFLQFVIKVKIFLLEHSNFVRK